MKLSDLQRHKLNEAYINSSSLLSEIKKETLKGKRLKNMIILEEVVQRLEVLIIG